MLCRASAAARGAAAVAAAGARSTPARLSHGARHAPASGAASTSAASFIERARHEGGAALVGAFTCRDDRFDAAFRDMVVDAMDPRAGEARCSFVVTPALANSWGTLHGGAVATLVDILGTLALVAKDKDKAGVSVEINVSYVGPARLGERVVAVGQVLKLGRTMGFTAVELVADGGDGKEPRLVAVGRHTKAFPAS